MSARLLLSTCCALPLAACAGNSDPDPEPGTLDAPALVDAGPGAGDAPAGNTARLAGVIRRSAAPQGDARGHVYVAVFDRDPIANMDTAVVVSNALLSDVDLAAAGVTVPYVVDDIPPRAEDYFLIAFLDDNGNVDQSDPDAAGPDRGDLVSLMGVSAPRITLATAGDHAHDIDLNLVMPF